MQSKRKNEVDPDSLPTNLLLFKQTLHVQNRWDGSSYVMVHWKQLEVVQCHLSYFPVLFSLYFFVTYLQRELILTVDLKSLSKAINGELYWSTLISRWDYPIRAEVSAFHFLRNLLSTLFFKHSLFFLLKVFYFCDICLLTTSLWNEEDPYQVFITNSCGVGFEIEEFFNHWLV